MEDGAAVDGGGESGCEAGRGGRRAEDLLRRGKMLLTRVREMVPGTLAGTEDVFCEVSVGEGVDAAGDPMLQGRQRRRAGRGLPLKVFPRRDVQ